MSEKPYLMDYVGKESAGIPESLQKAVALGRDTCFAELETSGLVGRGGAGFPTARKWDFARGREGVVLICNGDEGEPGTFKDRYLLECGTRTVLEGVLISAFVLQASEVYLYIRGEYQASLTKVRQLLEEEDALVHWYRRQVDPRLNVTLVAGAGAYVCGDETSLINSIEGWRPNSRIKPPYPAVKGLFGQPTIVNNVETLCNLPLIVRDGGAAYAKLGVPGNRGTKLLCLSGKLQRPGLYEIELGRMSFAEVVDELGGGCGEHPVKFIIPGGVSTRVLSADELQVMVDYDSLKRAGSSLGSGAVIVADQSVDAVEVACRAADFFKRETCGICFPCKEGNRQIHHLLQQIRQGRGKLHYLALIREIAATTALTARCGLGQSAGNLIVSTIEKFREDYMTHLLQK
jgi:NADH-quinone oxidoreductase subunit F